MDSQKYFDSIASHWDKMQESFFSDNVRNNAICASGIKAGQVAADIGAGTGFLTSGLIAKDVNVIAIDQSSEMLCELQNKIGICDKLKILQGESTELPLEDCSVDAAFANMYLHHVATPADAIKEMTRIIKPGGVLIITDLDTHSYEFLRTEHHDTWLGFDRKEINRLFKDAGLTSVCVRDIGESCCTCSQISCDKASITIFLAIGYK